MKRIFYLIAGLLIMQITINAQTNDFYDDAPLQKLKMQTITVAGEIANPGIVSLQELPLREIIVKETVFDGKSGTFTGAYLYEGYSVYDILNHVVLKKKNETEFPPIIDLFVEIENDKGEKVVLSWGEIYYPIHRHEILIASGVRRIVPSKTKELWPLPGDCKLVVASDLYTERNISNPVKITVRSSKIQFKIDRNIPEMYASEINLLNGSNEVLSISEGKLPGQLVSYGNVYYGRGTGIHGTSPFTGVMLKEITAELYPLSAENIRTALFVVSAPDGYRAVFTYSEIFNRNDQAEVLIVPMTAIPHKGAFMLYPAADYFSDRSIRSLNEVRFVQMSDI